MNELTTLVVDSEGVETSYEIVDAKARSLIPTDYVRDVKLTGTYTSSTKALKLSVTVTKI